LVSSSRLIRVAEIHVSFNVTCSANFQNLRLTRTVRRFGKRSPLATSRPPSGHVAPPPANKHARYSSAARPWPMVRDTTHSTREKQKQSAQPSSSMACVGFVYANPLVFEEKPGKRVEELRRLQTEKVRLACRCRWIKIVKKRDADHHTRARASPWPCVQWRRMKPAETSHTNPESCRVFRNLQFTPLPLPICAVLLLLQSAKCSACFFSRPQDTEQMLGVQWTVGCRQKEADKSLSERVAQELPLLK